MAEAIHTAQPSRQTVAWRVVYSCAPDPVNPPCNQKTKAAIASTCSAAQSSGGQRVCFIAAYLLFIWNEPVQSAGGGDSM